MFRVVQIHVQAYIYNTNARVGARFGVPLIDVLWKVAQHTTVSVTPRLKSYFKPRTNKKQPGTGK